MSNHCQHFDWDKMFFWVYFDLRWKSFHNISGGCNKRDGHGKDEYEGTEYWNGSQNIKRNIFIQ